MLGPARRVDSFCRPECGISGSPCKGAHAMQCRCTRNTSCSKPAGHPGFCSGPRAAAAVTAWHSRQGSPSRAGGRTRSDGSPQRPSRSRQRLLHTPSGKPDAECPKAVPSENPVSCEELAAATPDMKAEAQTLHNHQPQVHTEKEEREEESAQLIANQDQPPNAPPRQAGVAEEGRPFVTLPGTLPPGSAGCCPL